MKEHNLVHYNMYIIYRHRIAGEFGGELNLAVWKSASTTTKSKYATVSYFHNNMAWDEVK